MSIQEVITEKHTKITIAPLAGYTLLPFRKLLREFGFKGLYYNEMINPFEILKGNLKKLLFENDEHPIGIQLFGGYFPNKYKNSIKIIYDNFHFDIIDLNMGCPVKKVIHAGGGVYLLKHFDEVHKILSEIREVWDGPLSVKTRIGYTLDDINETIKNLQTLEPYNLKFITIHFRTVKEGFNTTPHYELYNLFKKELPFPIIYNGGIYTPPMLEFIEKEIKPYGIMLAQGILENPLLFKKEKMGLNSKIEFAKKFLQYFINYYPEEKLRETRKFFVYLFKGEIFAKQIREKIFKAQTLSEYLNSLKSPFL